MPAPFEEERHPTPRKGMINPRMVRLWSFVIISVCLLASAVICILAIWDFTRSDAVWRAFATMLVVAMATWILSVVNERFGD